MGIWLKIKRLFNPYLCHKCGKQMRKAKFDDLDKRTIELHKAAGSLGDMLFFSYKCEKCNEVRFIA